MIAVRDLRQEDLPEVSSWFAKYKWPFPALPNILPKTGGMVAFDGEKLLACAFLYTTGTSLAFVEWTATSPDLDDKQARAALEAVITKIKDCAQAIDPPIIALCQYVANDKLKTHYEKLGFKNKGQMSQMLWMSKKS